ncbi:MAG: SdpI family protein [Sciscionella sp.]
MGDAATVVRLVVLIVDVALGAPLLLIGVLGLRGRIAEHGRLGVRSAAATRDSAHFRLANRAAGAPWLVAGAIAGLAGLLALVLPHNATVLTVGVIGLLAAVGLSAAGGALGHRAAAALPVARPACTGCVCSTSDGGCSVLAGSGQAQAGEDNA